MVIKFVLCVVLIQNVATQVLYDTYFGKPITEERNNTLIQLNATRPCTIAVEPCRNYEGRRVDGTCVNPKYPSRNGSPTPLLRMLPASFGMGSTLRQMMNGSELPSARIIRTSILTEGYQADHHFNVLMSDMAVRYVHDIIDLRYITRYALVSECCIGNTPNRASPDCIAIPVPGDDPFLRRSGVQCMNLTRFQTFQDFQCIPRTLPAERLSLQTPLPDMSDIYGFTEEMSRSIRAFQGGLLTSEVRDGIERPPGNSPWCLGNRRPEETACYRFGDDFNCNLKPGGVLASLIVFREHNRIARKLAEINPCWNDQQLFDKTREIQIAQFQHMLYYELMPLILGKNNMQQVGLIYDTQGYVNDFDEKYQPGVFHEFVLGMRYFHGIQEGRNDLYSDRGRYLGTRTTVDDLLRSGIMQVNNIEADLTQGSFRQPTAEFDKNFDPDIVERIFGIFQFASDVAAIDITRGRDHGLPPYNAYRKICGLPVATKWEDFKEIRDDRLEQFQRIYGDVDEVELMPAIYSEKLMKDSYVGPTLFCIMTQNLLQWRKSDRYFFENGESPAAFTLPQLNEIRKASNARLMCDSGVGVTEIQPQALLNIDKYNRLVPCNTIPGMDLGKWRDPKCFDNENHYEDKNNFGGYLDQWGSYIKNIY